ncbi:MAG TPA: hypothetical protein VMI73_03000 [Trebonia sp.]|nr:hypothetical protein [Trebonia sp.]
MTVALDPATVTAVTCAEVSFPWAEVAWPARTAEKLEPFSSRLTLFAVGVVASKNVTQFVATVFAAPVRFAGMFESEPEAAADGDAEVLAAEAEALGDEAEDVGEAGGVEEVELDELHAASARQLAVAATARKLRGRMFIRHVPPEDRVMLG